MYNLEQVRAIDVGMGGGGFELFTTANLLTGRIRSYLCDITSTTL